MDYIYGSSNTVTLDSYSSNNIFGCTTLELSSNQEGKVFVDLTEKSRRSDKDVFEYVCQISIKANTTIEVTKKSNQYLTVVDDTKPVICKEIVYFFSSIIIMFKR